MRSGSIARRTTALAFVARRLELEPVLIWFAVRAGAMSGVDDAGLPELDLVGLGDAAAARLLDEQSVDLSVELKRRILVEAGGNPLALIELPIIARSLSLEAQPTWSDFLPLTARLERAFAGRLDELDADARALLLVAALEERRFSGTVAGSGAATRQSSRPGRLEHDCGRRSWDGWGRGFPLSTPVDPIGDHTVGRSRGATVGARGTRGRSYRRP
jgi:hypothetical protein